MDNKKRIHWIDIAKGVAILLVVIGHVIREGVLQKIVYSFHVPVFVFVSGMLVKDGKDNITKDFKNLMIPYYSFGIISILLFSVMGAFAGERIGVAAEVSVFKNVGALLYGKSYLQFNAPIWFLPCLFIIKAIYYTSKKVTGNNNISQILTAIMFSCAGFLLTELKLSRLPYFIVIAMKMMVFFFAGKIISDNINMADCCQKYRYKFMAVLPFTIGVLLLLSYKNEKINYTSDTFPDPIGFYITAFVGIFAVSIFSIVLDRSRILEYIGRNTLSVLLLHRFPVAFFQIIGPFKNALKRYDTAGCYFSALIVTFISVFLCIVAFSVIKCCLSYVIGRRKIKNEFDERL